jgi:hypothetical protein
VLTLPENFALIFLIFAIILGFIIIQGNRKVLIIRNQRTNEIYLQKTVHKSDIIIFGWIHSFEHIPWNEYYKVLEDDQLLLETIEIAGFGAGIPNNKGKVTVDDNGMSDINEKFEHINWIHSQTALDFIKLDEAIIGRGSDFPHHESLILEIKDR